MKQVNMDSKYRKRPFEQSKNSAIDRHDIIPPRDTSLIPVRDCGNLFVAHATAFCAFGHRCIPCAYKIGCFDVALDTEFTRLIQNQRPEMCHRERQRIGRGNATTEDEELCSGLLGFRPGMHILTVGDGDFTFSLALARALGRVGQTSKFDGAMKTKTAPTRIVATSYESRDCLSSYYPVIERAIQELESLGATVAFNVDATKLRASLATRCPWRTTSFHRIVWNFPCEAVEGGQDGQNQEMERNKELIFQFAQEARFLLDRDGGQIHINHKTKPPFDQWKIEDIVGSSAVSWRQGESRIESQQAKSDTVQEGNHNGNKDMYPSRLGYACRIVFDRGLFPPYVPRKARHANSFPSHDACTFVFVARNEQLCQHKNQTETVEKSIDDPLSEAAKSALLSVCKELPRGFDLVETSTRHGDHESNDDAFVRAASTSPIVAERVLPATPHFILSLRQSLLDHGAVQSRSHKYHKRSHSKHHKS